jgi:hypothetical protein
LILISIEIVADLSELVAIVKGREAAQDPTSQMAMQFQKMSLGITCCYSFIIRTDEPVLGSKKAMEGISLDSPEDVAVYNKIMKAVIVKNCGYRSFDDYAGGEPLKRFFTQIGIDRFRYNQFQDAHPNTESILLFGPPGTGKTLAAGK